MKPVRDARRSTVTSRRDDIDCASSPPNNDGTWNNTGDSFEFAVEPAIYQNAWVQTLLVCSGLATLWFLGWLRIRAIQRRIELGFAERLAERERIARDLHDTLLQGVFGLMMQFQRAAAGVKDSASKAELERAIDQAETVIRDGRGRLKGLRRHSPSPGGLAEELATVAHQCSAAGTAQFQLSVSGTVKVLRAAVREEIVMFREALVDAFTHSNGSKVSLQIDYRFRRLHVSVVDDGCGIEDHVLRAGRREDHWALPGNWREGRAHWCSAHYLLSTERWDLCPSAGARSIGV